MNEYLHNLLTFSFYISLHPYLGDLVKIITNFKGGQTICCPLYINYETKLIPPTIRSKLQYELTPGRESTQQLVAINYYVRLQSYGCAGRPQSIGDESFPSNNGCVALDRLAH